LVDLLATAAAEQDGRIDGALARRMLGLSHDDRAIALLEALAERDVAKGLQTIADAVDAGLEMRAFGRQTLGLLRTLMLVRAGANPPEADDTTRALAERFELLDLLRINRHFADQDLAIRNGGFPQLPLELALVAAIVEPEAAVAPALAAPAPERAPSRPRPTLVETPRSDAWRERPAERRREPERPSERPRETPAPPPAREPTPLRRPQPAVTAGGDALAGIVAQWERVRTEVKALDRKVEALLASTDPGAFDGRQLTLISAYPFHASKLNDPRARQYVEQAVERILGSPVTVTTVVRDEFAPPPTAAAPRAAASAPEPVIEEDFAPYAPANPADDPDEALVRVVKTMFDAEEVDPDEP
jgi:DNA polymerase-3 subunit gamma/tau